MSFPTMTRVRACVLLVLALCLGANAAGAASTAEQPTYPHDLSPAGLRAAAANGDAAAQAHLESTILPEVAIEALRNFVIETRALGLTSRSGRVSFDLGVPNVRANDPAQAPDRVGEAQSEVSVCVNGDTVVVAWNDSRAFTVGPSPGIGTLSGYGYSLDGGATFTDGGSVPRAVATDNPSGDTDIDTDEQGNWYLNSIYTRTAAFPGPVAQQNISVHNGVFIGGVLTWNTPTMASIGTAATGNLDKCFLTCDRVSGNVYVAYTRFLATPAIEIVRSTDNGATWSAPTILDNTVVPTASKQAANPICGPAGEVYVVWEKGANLINCADGAGNLTPVQAQIAFSKSTDFGLTYSAFQVIAQPVTNFMASGPGDNRERGNEFPDISVDRSGLAYNGRIYVTYHDTAPWTTNIGPGVPYAEAQSATNGQAGSPEPVVIGNDVSGSCSATTDFDYYSFTAVQGVSYMFTLDPQGFNCGVSGTTRGMRFRLYANSTPAPTSTFSDSLLAASFQGAFTNRIIWTAPKTDTYKLRISPAQGAFPATYVMKLRPLVFTPAGGARDARDVVVVSSSDGGTTWTAPALVNDDPAGLENRRPFISTDAKGHVHAFWHDSREGGFGTNATLTSIYGVTSRDGGATWTPNYGVTDELSFFSFNSIAIPNMGDYNMAASDGDLTLAAWSDQRLSTGDVFNPATLTYTAGLGPEAYTARVKFLHEVLCPPGPVVIPDGTSDSLTFCITNTGTTPDTYNWTVSDANGWTCGPAAGNTGVVRPGDTICFRVCFDMPPGCTPSPSSLVTFTATPEGDPDGAVSCTVKIECDIVVPSLIAFFDAATEGDRVRLTWSAEPSSGIAGFNVYRGVNPEAITERVNESLIVLGQGGDFSIEDVPSVQGTVWYRLAAVSRTGEEGQSSVISVTVNALPTAFSFRLAGANPFHGAVGTTFAYTLPVSVPVRLALYDVSGRKVASLVDGVQPAGAYTISLARAGRALPAGGYVARLDAGSFSKTVRVIALP